MENPKEDQAQKNPPPPPGADGRQQFNPGMVAWTALKELRDANRRVADSADLLMQAIEAAPELDAAMCIGMGIKPRIPSQMGGGQKPGFTVDPQHK